MMKGYPKNIGSGQDLYNLLAMVQAGELAASDLRGTISELEARRFLACPILELNKTRKAATVGYCAEAAAGASGSGTISKVEHERREDAGGAGGMDADSETPTHTIITFAEALPEDAAVVFIPAPVDPLTALGITPEQIEAIKEVLNANE